MRPIVRAGTGEAVHTRPGCCSPPDEPADPGPRSMREIVSVEMRNFTHPGRHSNHRGFPQRGVIQKHSIPQGDGLWCGAHQDRIHSGDRGSGGQWQAVGGTHICMLYHLLRRLWIPRWAWEKGGVGKLREGVIHGPCPPAHSH